MLWGGTEDGRRLIWESCEQILDGKEGETVDKLGGCGICDRNKQQTIDINEGK